MNRAERRAMARAQRRMHASAMYRNAKRASGRAYARSELDADQCRDLALIGHAAMSALTRGQAADVDVDNLALLCNVAMVLSEHGLGSDLLDDIRTARDALVGVQERIQRTGRIGGATGPELQALNLLLEIHDAQLAIPPTVDEMRRAIGEVRRRREAGEVVGTTGESK